MDLLRHWHKMMNVIPWIQDLLEVCASGSVPRPQGMCLSCRGRQAVSEVSAGKTHKPSNRPAAAADRRAEEYRTTAVIFNHLSDSEKTRENEIPGAEERSVHRLRPVSDGGSVETANSMLSYTAGVTTAEDTRLSVRIATQYKYILLGHGRNRSNWLYPIAGVQPLGSTVTPKTGLPHVAWSRGLCFIHFWRSSNSYCTIHRPRCRGRTHTSAPCNPGSAESLFWVTGGQSG
ncbi:uncharacterized protein [Phyllobates terribilis]|uniref:uncharacterized protein isoform X2 n=1 Tax=Phyllobates terribilis TaxID=111132 RepID=UPI003CCB18B4